MEVTRGAELAAGRTVQSLSKTRDGAMIPDGTRGEREISNDTAPDLKHPRTILCCRKRSLSCSQVRDTHKYYYNTFMLNTRKIEECIYFITLILKKYKKMLFFFQNMLWENVQIGKSIHAFTCFSWGPRGKWDYETHFVLSQNMARKKTFYPGLNIIVVLLVQKRWQFSVRKIHSNLELKLFTFFFSQYRVSAKKKKKKPRPISSKGKVLCVAGPSRSCIKLLHFDSISLLLTVRLCYVHGNFVGLTIS